MKTEGPRLSDLELEEKLIALVQENSSWLGKFPFSLVYHDSTKFNTISNLTVDEQMAFYKDFANTSPPAVDQIRTIREN